MPATDIYYSAKHWSEKARKQAVGTLDENPVGSAKHWAEQASSSATAAAASEGTVQTYAETASTKATEAAASALTASTSATAAAASASSALNSAASAQQSETNASNYANSASQSASEALSSKTSAQTSASQAQTYATNASSSATSAQQSAEDAEYWAGQAISGQVQADWNQTDSSQKDYIKNKPTKLSQFTNDTNFVNTTQLATKQDNLTATQLNAVNSGITSSKVSTYDGYSGEIATKQDSLTTTQLSAVNSGITSSKVSTYDGYQSQINNKQDTLSTAQLAAVNSGITDEDDYIIEQGNDDDGQYYLKTKKGNLIIFATLTSTTSFSAIKNWVVPFTNPPYVIGSLGNLNLLDAQWVVQAVNVGTTATQFQCKQSTANGRLFVIAFGNYK